MTAVERSARTGGHTVAFSVDLVLALIVFRVLREVAESASPTSSWATSVVLFALVWFAYQLGLTSAFGATVGMAIFRLKLEAADGGPLSLPRRAVRAAFFSAFFLLAVMPTSGAAASPAVTVATLLLMGESALMVFDRRRRAGHDRLLGAVVVAGWPSAAVPTRRQNLGPGPARWMLASVFVVGLGFAVALLAGAVGNEPVVAAGAALVVLGTFMFVWSNGHSGT